MKRGNVLIIAVIFIAICIVVILFIATIFMSHVNSILYNFKLEMYSINKSAIIAVNKTNTSIDDFSYNKKVYKEYFLENLKKSYKLDNDLRNINNLITEIDLLEYDIYEVGEKDKYSKKICNNRVIHSVIKVKIKPIIMKEIFEDIFTFTIHEDVNLNMMYVRE